jgi:hypothetical protein
MKINKKIFKQLQLLYRLHLTTATQVGEWVGVCRTVPRWYSDAIGNEVAGSFFGHALYTPPHMIIIS